MKTTNHMDVDRIVSLLVTKHPEISAEDAGTLLREWVALITENLLREESVETEPFGTFDCSPVSDGDPACPSADSGETAKYYRIGFTPSASLQKRVNSYFAHFEPSLLNEGVSFDELSTVVLGEEKAEEIPDNRVRKTVRFATPAPSPVEPVASEPVASEPVAVEPVALEPVASEPVVSEQIAPQKHLPPASLQRHTERKRKSRSPLWIPIIGGVAIIVAGLFFFIPPPPETVQLTVDKLPVETSAPAPEPSPERIRETVVLGEGKTLRLLAEELFGSREFWVYIYLENRHIIQDPNRISVGVTLIIPDLQSYDIDPADPASVSRAKQLGNKVLQSR